MRELQPTMKTFFNLLCCFYIKQTVRFKKNIEKKRNVFFYFEHTLQKQKITIKKKGKRIQTKNKGNRLGMTKPFNKIAMDVYYSFNVSIVPG